MQNILLIPIFITFPETVLIVILGLSMAKNNKKINMNRVLYISFLQSIFVGILLMMELSSGVRSIFQILILCLVTMLVLNLPLQKAVVPILMGGIILGTLQNVLFPLFSYLFNIEIELLKENIIYSIHFYFPVFLICMILLIIIRKKGLHLYEL